MTTFSLPSSVLRCSLCPSSVSLFPYLLTFSCLPRPLISGGLLMSCLQAAHTALTQRAACTLTWILHQSLITFHANCKTWRRPNQRVPCGFSACAAKVHLLQTAAVGFWWLEVTFRNLGQFFFLNFFFAVLTSVHTVDLTEPEAQLGADFVLIT